MFKRFFSILIATFFVFAPFFSKADERIKMTLENGVYTMPCEVNGLRMKFVFDTGASMVSISMTEARFMYKNGYIDDNDFIGTAKTRIANGDIEENMKLNLKEVKVGNKTLYNVEALVSNSSNAPLLLGQSVLRQLGTWSVDNDYLVIKDSNAGDDDENEEDSYTIADADEFYQLALSYYNSGNEKKAAECFNDAADIYYDNELFDKFYQCAEYSANLNNAKGQDYLGICFLEGRGATQNYEKAIYWFKKGAEQGDPNAQNNFGNCYQNGNGVIQNDKQAVYWYQKGAEQGNLNAQYNLGVCYDDGIGITQNYQQAVYWYKKAAEQGHLYAQNNLGVCYKKGKGVIQNDKQAIYWWKKAAVQGFAQSQYHLGICYNGGIGIDQSYQQAFYWYKKAAEQGHVEAQYNLGIYYHKGYCETENHEKSVYWWEKAAKQGLVQAQYNLGYCYYFGDGIQQNYEYAKYWFEKAAEQGYRDAQIMLKKLK